MKTLKTIVWNDCMDVPYYLNHWAGNCAFDSMMREEKKTHDHLRNTTQIIQVMLHLYFMEVQVVFMTRQTFINVEILEVNVCFLSSLFILRCKQYNEGV